jgi:hypothetical protein
MGELTVASQDPIEILRQGADVWNPWREANFTVLDLAKADLRAMDLAKVNLSNMDLTGANLSGAKLRGARLSKATLTDADLFGADLREADLVAAVLHTADLYGADLRDADLRDADLRGADLRQAKMNRACLTDTRLNDVDLRDTYGLRLDRTWVRGAVFPTRIWPSLPRFRNTENGDTEHVTGRLPWSYAREDPWSRLRRVYTGPSMLLVLLLVVAFLTPLVLRLVLWAQLAETQGGLLVLLHRASDAIETDASAADSALHNALLRASASVQNAEQIPVWKLVLGSERGWRNWQPVLRVLLLFYNGLRCGVTVAVVRMREADERNQVTPAWKEYRYLNWMHWVLFYLQFVAVAAAVYHLYIWGSISIYKIW